MDRATSREQRSRCGTDGLREACGVDRARGDKAQLDVLWLAAELTLSMHAPLVPDLAKRIEGASIDLAARRDRALRAYARTFEIYGPLTRPPSSAAAR